MKLWLVIIHIALVGANFWVTAHFHEDVLEDNEFAEFEDFEEEKPVTKPLDNEFKRPAKNEAFAKINENAEDEGETDIEEDGLVEDESDSEFDHFQDEEEFEGVDKSSNGLPKTDEPSTLTITKVPLHLRAQIESFYLEMLMIAGLLVYFINYATGRSKNWRLTTNWFKDHKQILQDNFSLVADTGKGSESPDESLGLIKESESQFSIYCSGRVGCEFLLVELRLIKRQDLVALVSQLVRPINDQVHFRFEISKDETDNYVLAIATKKTASSLVRDMTDISVYCPEKRPGEKFGLPPGFLIMSEIGEALSAILDTKVIQVFNKYAPFIDYIHISDQYSKPKQQEETTPLTLPEVKRVLIVGLNMTIKGSTTGLSDTDKMKPLLQLTFYLMDKIRRFKLSKEGRAKTDKNRQRVEEAFMKTTHAARAEAAAQRREDKRKAEKDKILQEEDPEKQRKWEEKEQRRQAKKRAPRMKQLKVKAL